MIRALYKPNVDRAAKVRADLAGLGLKANVRYFRHSIRVVLPEFGSKPEVADTLRDYMVEAGFTFAGGTSPTSPTWRHCWDHYNGRAQFFLYDIR